MSTPQSLGFLFSIYLSGLSRCTGSMDVAQMDHQYLGSRCFHIHARILLLLSLLFYYIVLCSGYVVFLLLKLKSKSLQGHTLL